MSLRFVAFGLACLLVLLPQPAMAGQVQLGMSLDDFIAAYNSVSQEQPPLAPPEDREEQVFGIRFLPAYPGTALFVQLAYDGQNDLVLFCGAIFDPQENDSGEALDTDAFRGVAQTLMQVVFPELSPEEHLALLEQVLSEDEEIGEYDDRQDNTQYLCIEGECALTYIVGPEEERNLILYRIEI